MSYLDNGFDQFMQRDSFQNLQNQSQQLDPLAFDSFVDQINGSKIQGGTVLSTDGKTQINLDQGIYKVNNGTQDLITLGLLPDGSTGLMIKDLQGNILLQISDSVGIIQSSSKKFQLSFIDENITVYDDSNIPVAIFGKLS